MKKMFIEDSTGPEHLQPLVSLLNWLALPPFHGGEDVSYMEETPCGGIHPHMWNQYATGNRVNQTLCWD